MEHSEYKNCLLCPRKCGVDRTAGEKGFCRAGADGIRIGRAALHYYEEPCISGESGSGAVFFSGCSLRCDYCQNRSLSRDFSGVDASEERLCEIFLELEKKGANNINLVTATQYAPSVVSAISEARKRGLSIPTVWNGSGYELAETLRMLEETVDIWLPDMKYLSSEVSGKYSLASDYPEVAKKAVAEMVRQKPTPVFDDDGMMKKGVIIRHLLLPGELEESKKILSYLFSEYGNSVWYSIMAQYTPQPLVSFEVLKSTVPYEEYLELVSFAEEIGIENGFIQEEGTADDSFIPDFNGEGVLK